MRFLKNSPRYINDKPYPHITLQLQLPGVQPASPSRNIQTPQAVSEHLFEKVFIMVRCRNRGEMGPLHPEGF